MVLNDITAFQIFNSVAIGLLCFKIVKIFLPWVYLNVIGPYFLGPKLNIRSMGGWAVITGSTDGIGRAYANALAKRGFSLVLISRSLSKLEDVAKEIENKYKVETKIIDVDFQDSVEIYDKIKAGIEGLDIGVLINNVATSYSYPEYFHLFYQQNPKVLQDLVSVNIHSVTHMCALVLPVMLSRKKGLIINVSSSSSTVPSALLTLYSGTKAFVDKFSQDLQTEYRDSGITIQCIKPGFVATKMSKLKVNISCPTPETYVASALNFLGYSTTTTGYFPHHFLQISNDFMLYLTCEPFVSNIFFKYCFNMRKSALKRLSQKK
ncbi:very-long-chain 3-oxoacyl-CoA reductase-B [Bactrocera neohumeralis]|uniref:very-long-chain 3-oxoacyl-CoA reductase-B n=1 Tax=Bactrocera tryoni TaxID=59916 RepID=UPI001A989936|nr:very-long-chain 3-oxoacyl-CoA reductase-B [Bactrocera tryoni]XP_050329291.1 very-long-chain 3-oxoacyl-CoA reductase-B [Bactrocera neohumeralis]